MKPGFTTSQFGESTAGEASATSKASLGATQGSSGIDYWSLVPSGLIDNDSGGGPAHEKGASDLLAMVPDTPKPQT